MCRSWNVELKQNKQMWKTSFAPECVGFADECVGFADVDGFSDVDSLFDDEKPASHVE